MGKVEETLGIPDIIERLRKDLTESQRRLVARREEVMNLPAVRDYVARQEAISDATFVQQLPPDQIPEPLPPPIELAQLDAPLTLHNVTIELEVVVETNAGGGIDLKILSADAARTNTRSNKVVLTLQTPAPMEIGG